MILFGFDVLKSRKQIAFSWDKMTNYLINSMRSLVDAQEIVKNPTIGNEGDDDIGEDKWLPCPVSVGLIKPESMDVIDLADK